MKDSVDDITKIFSTMLAKLMQSGSQIKQLQLENKRLREALQMCSPFIPKGTKVYNCSFCTEPYDLHAKDCEYIRLSEVQE